MLIMNLQNLKQENAMLLVIKITQTMVKEMKIVQPLNLKPKSLNQVFVIIQTHPNGHISIDTPSIRSRNSTWKVRRNYIDFEGRIHVEIITSIRREYFDVDSTFKIEEISIKSPRGFSHVVLTLNRCNFCTYCFILSFSNIFFSGNLF